MMGWLNRLPSSLLSMSTPEALQEYAAFQAETTAAALAKLARHHVDQDEIERVKKILEQDSTAAVHGDGFTIYRDVDNQYQVRFDHESNQAA